MAQEQTDCLESPSEGQGAKTKAQRESNFPEFPTKCLDWMLLSNRAPPSTSSKGWGCGSAVEHLLIMYKALEFHMHFCTERWEEEKEERS